MTATIRHFVSLVWRLTGRSYPALVREAGSLSPEAQKDLLRLLGDVSDEVARQQARGLPFRMF
jgi:hypothetical protein